jgi:hypothetical protein
MSDSADSQMKSDLLPHQLSSPNARRLKKPLPILLPHELYGLYTRGETNHTAAILLSHELYGVIPRMERKNGQDNSEDSNGSQHNTPMKKQLSESLKGHPSNPPIFFPHEFFHRHNRTEKSIPHQSSHESVTQKSAHDSFEESNASQHKSTKNKRKLFCFCFRF